MRVLLLVSLLLSITAMPLFGMQPGVTVALRKLQPHITKTVSQQLLSQQRKITALKRGYRTKSDSSTNQSQTCCTYCTVFVWWFVCGGLGIMCTTSKGNRYKP